MADNKKENDMVRERSGSINFNDHLTSFLYELIRDHLPAGTIEMLVRNSIGHGETQYTNGWLANYAHDLAQRITNNIANEDLSFWNDKIK